MLVSSCLLICSKHSQCRGPSVEKLAAAHLAVLASDASHDSEGEGDEGPNDQDDADGPKGQGCSGVVSNGNCVEEGECDEQRSTEQGHCQQYIAYLQGSATPLTRFSLAGAPC